MKKERIRILGENKKIRTRNLRLPKLMRIIRHNQKNKMNKLRTDDYGKMRWVRKNLKRKLIEQINWKHIRIKQMR